MKNECRRRLGAAGDGVPVVAGAGAVDVAVELEEPSSWTARTDAGVASVTDCSAKENRNNAVHSRVRLLRVRAFIENQSPRDIG